MKNKTSNRKAFNRDVNYLRWKMSIHRIKRDRGEDDLGDYYMEMEHSLEWFCRKWTSSKFSLEKTWTKYYEMMLEYSKKKNKYLSDNWDVITKKLEEAVKNSEYIQSSSLDWS